MHHEVRAGVGSQSPPLQGEMRVCWDPHAAYRQACTATQNGKFLGEIGDDAERPLKIRQLVLATRSINVAPCTRFLETSPVRLPRSWRQSLPSLSPRYSIGGNCASQNLSET